MKKFVKPEIEIININGVDILTTSGGGQLNFSGPDTEVTPDDESAAVQKNWGGLTFNK